MMIILVALLMISLKKLLQKALEWQRAYIKSNHSDGRHWNSSQNTHRSNLLADMDDEWRLNKPNDDQTATRRLASARDPIYQGLSGESNNSAQVRNPY
jgi:hypothetical protein